MSAEWDFLITLNEQLRPLRDPLEIQDVALRMICEHLHVSRGTFAYVDGEEFAISRSFGVNVLPMAGRGPVTRFGSAIAEACRRGETAVVNDLNADPRFTDEEREWLRGRTIGAFVAVPLIKDGQLVATLGASYTAPCVWTRDQIALLEATAERTWGTVERARAEDALGLTESRQRFLRRVTEGVQPIADPAAIVAETCRLLVTYLRVNRASYFRIEGDDAVTVGSYEDGLPSPPGRYAWRP